MTAREMARVAKKNYVLMQISGMLPQEEYEIYIKKYFNTASWRFYNGKHQIVIGTDIFVNMIDIFNVEHKHKYLDSYLKHELAHSIWTDKNLIYISTMLREKKIPFQLFNLFEDARIEESMRNYTKKAFKWFEYEEMITPQNVLDIFFYILQSEHNKKDMRVMKLDLGEELMPALTRAFDYYKRVVACTSSLDVVKIVEEWCKEFPETYEYIERIEYIGYLFCEESKYLIDDEKFDELIKDALNVLSPVPPEEIKHSSEKLKDGNSIQSCLLSRQPVSIAYPTRERDLLLHEMEKLFLAPDKFYSSELPAKRLNLKRLASGSKKLFKKKEQPKQVKKKITIILDMSGSMGATIENMRLIIDVMDKMVQKNIIDATLILTAASGSGSIYEILNMPLEKDVIERLVPSYGGEGLASTMKANIQLLSSSDYTWILTDGMIDDKPLKKEFFHVHNIRTHGMYIGNTLYKTKMNKSFDYVVCEKNVIDLCRELFTLIK
ncbi:hypothetical protein GJV85_08770 [Sulfurimonas aquatica]|uniref:VWA domain-containing protein n=1 Tax=Sulfurimonas aquatica TaxID=2672570 RepID=A0A975GD12_9BACT|nr:hypothetical protein [Sulfurimonas aquatica]QSZ42200.1 hypothetical protein GJV85_08770 [Sulfurimonas aquatica]